MVAMAIETNQLPPLSKQVEIIFKEANDDTI